MNKLTFLGLLFFTLSSSLIAEEDTKSEYYVEIVSQPEIISDINESSLISNEFIIDNEPVIETITEEYIEVVDGEIVTETKNVRTQVIKEESLIELTPYETVLEKAKNEDKIIMLAIRATDCNYCDKMEAETLSQSSVQNALDADFVTIHYNQDLEPLPLGLQEGMTPNFIFVNNNEDIINMYPGMRTPEEFKEALAQILAE